MPPAEGETGGQVLGSQVLKVINESTNQNAAVKRIEFVGPSVGADLAQTGAMALMAALLSILVYVGFRFGGDWRQGLLLRWRTTLSLRWVFCRYSISRLT